MKDEKEQLNQFLVELRILVDKYHPYIYQMDDVFEAINMIEKSIQNKIKNQ